MPRCALIYFLFGLISTSLTASNSAATSNSSSGKTHLLEVAGRVERSAIGTTHWTPAVPGALLQPGDRIRTGVASRAAVQFSDQSLMRLGAETTLEIQSSSSVSKRRLFLWRGWFFFFHRGTPSDVDIRTPLASGAIRGTEFVTFVDDLSGATQLALIDGTVDISSQDQTLTLQSGEQIVVEPGKSLRKSVLVESQKLIQWALYYPTVVVPDEIAMDEKDRTNYREVLEYFRSGDLLRAQAIANRDVPHGNSSVLLLASLDLAVGRVEDCERRLSAVDAESSTSRALHELIAVIRNDSPRTLTQTREPESASEWLARSYYYQSVFDLERARTAARRAVDLAPNSGFPHARLAELEFGFGRYDLANQALDRALSRSPRLPSAHALRGFVQLNDHHFNEAFASFERAIALDAALGNAWLGRGLALRALGRTSESIQSLEAAAALEPNRSLPRSYLGKGFSDLAKDDLAEREFRLAQSLDPDDPTPWLYSALHQWRKNRITSSVRNLEISITLNDHQALFRSRLLLDQDRAIRSANLATLYADAGLSEAGQRRASRAVGDDPTLFSAHQFLSQSYQAQGDANGFNLRMGTAIQSELLLANLLAPPGAGNLSRLLSQQQHLQYFEPRSVAASSLTEYRSDGRWREAASLFGTVPDLTYAADTLYESRNGQRSDKNSELWDFSVQAKFRLSPKDDLLIQIGSLDFHGGDLAPHYVPESAKTDFRVTERQQPSLLAGYHRTWSPEHHTLLLIARHPDSLRLHDSDPTVLFLRRKSDETQGIETSPGFDLEYSSDFTLYSAEVQHLWRTPRNTLIAGGRWQSGAVNSEASLQRILTGSTSEDQLDDSLGRGSVYLYDIWKAMPSLQLTAGIVYDSIKYPKNSDIAPLTAGSTRQDHWSPKLGFSFEPWTHGLFQGAYTHSLGGLYFDNNFRLEPAQIAGFNQAFRSLIPESIAGIVPGTRFETAGISYDHTLRYGTYFGIEAEWLNSKNDRTVGALRNGSTLPIPDTATSLRQSLDFRERDISAYVVQWLGDQVSFGIRYRWSDATFDQHFPELPKSTAGLDLLESKETARLHRTTLSLNWWHPSGFFGQWESLWIHQSNGGYSITRPSEDLFHHSVYLGYRFPQRRAEIRMGLINLANSDFRLNPLNWNTELSRNRAWVASVRLNF